MDILSSTYIFTHSRCLSWAPLCFVTGFILPSVLAQCSLNRGFRHLKVVCQLSLSPLAVGILVCEPGDLFGYFLEITLCDRNSQSVLFFVIEIEEFRPE